MGFTSVFNFVYSEKKPVAFLHYFYYFAPGKTYEKIALEQFEKKYEVSVTACGMYINPEMPYIGATPDGRFVLNGRRCLVEIKAKWTIA